VPVPQCKAAPNTGGRGVGHTLNLPRSQSAGSIPNVGKERFSTLSLELAGAMIQKTQSIDLAKKFGRYYTPSRISRLLVSSMKRPDPALVLDLGSGRGSLSKAARHLWREIQLITVDIDPQFGDVLDREVCTTHGHRHVLADGLTFDLRDRLQLGNRIVGAALCNPPYVRIRHRKELVRLLQEAGLAHDLAENALVPADILFLAQNLRLLRSGGQIGILVPDGFACGEQYASLRRSLCDMHSIDRVISLPLGAFVRTEARAHVFIITKNGKQPRKIPVSQLDELGRLSQPLMIEIEEAEVRLDYAYFQERVIGRKRTVKVYLRDIPHSITRGSFNSAEAKIRNGVFHTTDFPIGSAMRFPSQLSILPGVAAPVMAAAGDILLARVGRKLQEQVCIVTSGESAISDCVLRLRVPQTMQKSVLKALTSTRGKSFLRSAARGSGARYLSRAALLELPVR
jgi:type I restriction enzyme M protein